MGGKKTLCIFTPRTHTPWLLAVAMCQGRLPWFYACKSWPVAASYVLFNWPQGLSLLPIHLPAISLEIVPLMYTHS